MKAGDLSIVYALRALREQGAELPGRVTVIHNSDEEIGSPSSRALIRGAATEADATFVLEAGRENGDVVIARKGIADIRVRVRGQAAHAGVNHDRGRSAVLSLARIVTAVESLNGTVPGVTLNVGQIEGGGRVNVVPDRASARLEVRAFERSLLESMLERVEHAIRGAVIDGTVAETDVSIEHWPMPRSDGGTRLFETARRLAESLGETLNGAETGGASDGNTAAGAGCPVLDGLGPVGGNTHSPSEYILAESIAPRTAILAGLVASVGNQPLPGVQ
jgi:glutamate carboxypeptidase